VRKSTFHKLFPKEIYEKVMLDLKISTLKNGS
jgi:hypothetical protein